MIQPIETVYKGYRFRSRLEARWAVFFDALKLEWEYEPEGFELGKGIRYLPDFYVRDWKCYAEVKSYGMKFDKAIPFVVKTKHTILLLEGPPEVQAYQILMSSQGHVQEDNIMLGFYHKHGGFYYSCGEFKNGELPQGDTINDYPDLIKAVNAARSARFEYNN